MLSMRLTESVLIFRGPNGHFGPDEFGHQFHPLLFDVATISIGFSRGIPTETVESLAARHSAFARDEWSRNAGYASLAKRRKRQKFVFDKLQATIQQ